MVYQLYWSSNSKLGKLVIDIAGEASVLMTMQIRVQYRLPIKIFILNNDIWAW